MSLIIFCIFTFLFLLLMKSRMDLLSKKFLYVFLSWWGVYLFCSTFNPCGLFLVSNETYIILLGYVVSFLIGFSAFSLKWNCQNAKKCDNIANVRVNWWYVLLGISSVIVVYNYACKYVLLLEVIGADRARDSLFESGLLFSTNYEIYLFQFLFTPFQTIVQFFLAYCIVFKSKFPFIYLIILVSYFFLYGYLGGGRANYLALFLYVILLFVLRTYIASKLHCDIRKYSLKFYFFFLLFCVIIVVVVSVQTILRKGVADIDGQTILMGFEELLSQFVWYMLGPIRALDYAFEYQYDSFLGFWYGRATIGGFDTLLKMIIHALGGNYTTANQVIGGYLQEHLITVGYGITFNFAYTALIFYYLDFGYFGILLWPFFLGIITRFLVHRFQKKPSLARLILMLFFFYATIFATFSWIFYKTASVVLIILLIIYQKYEQKSLCRHEC